MTEALQYALDMCGTPAEQFMNSSDLDAVKQFAQQQSAGSRYTGLCAVLKLEDQTYFAIASEFFPCYVDMRNDHVHSEETGELLGTIITGYEDGTEFVPDDERPELFMFIE